MAAVCNRRTSTSISSIRAGVAVPVVPVVLARHAHGVAHGAKGVAGGGALGDAEHALEGGRDAQAEAGEQGGQGAAGDEGQDDEEEDLPGVALGVVLQVAEEALELLDAALDEALAGGALVVRWAAFERMLLVFDLASLSLTVCVCARR